MKIKIKKLYHLRWNGAFETYQVFFDDKKVVEISEEISGDLSLFSEQISERYYEDNPASQMLDKKIKELSILLANMTQ